MRQMCASPAGRCSRILTICAEGLSGIKLCDIVQHVQDRWQPKYHRIQGSRAGQECMALTS